MFDVFLLLGIREMLLLVHVKESGIYVSSTQVLVNTACCLLMLIAKTIQCLVFGPLRVSEKQVRVKGAV